VSKVLFSKELVETVDMKSRVGTVGFWDNPMWHLAIIIGLVLAIVQPQKKTQAGDVVCTSCHQDVTAKWASSHHAKAMQPATEASVLGDFSGVVISHHGQKATFSISDGFQVTIGDQAGPFIRYKIAYTFGADPLQQYLVKTENGKFQVLPFAWDARRRDEGGQRWIHIYPEENLSSGDRLHWLGPLQNWNGMCADCHSTGLKREYDAETYVFKSTYQAVNVSCLSCHAEADVHAKEQKLQPQEAVDWKDELVSYLKEIDGFTFKDGSNTASWSGPKPRQRKEMQICAACHSLRAPLGDGIDPAKEYLDQFLPSLLDDQSYFPDGQIKGEVYVWGSFLQSKMHAAGVSCFDCHDSHSLKLKARGNGLCAQCHAGEMFDTSDHHKHPEGTKGAQCVNCHMPERTYMVVDPRRDHGFKMPRPDISAQTGSPNACVTCHADQSNSWASQMLDAWFPDKGHKTTDALTIHHARSGYPKARVDLARLIKDKRKPAIQRASALALIPRMANQALITVATRALADPSPLVRIGAMRALAAVPVEERFMLLEPLLSDDMKAVRVEAARHLLQSSQARLHTQAFSELLEADHQSAWRGEGRINLGLNYAFKGNTAQAEKEYRQAVKQDPSFAPAVINLAELLRGTGRPDAGHDLLKAAAEKEGAVDPALYHAFGLSLIRHGQKNQAITYLEKAMRADRANPRYVYVYLVATNTAKNSNQVYDSLKTALRRHRYDPNLLNFALSKAVQKRDLPYARRLLTALLEINPKDQQLLRLKRQLDF